MKNIFKLLLWCSFAWCLTGCDEDPACENSGQWPPVEALPDSVTAVSVPMSAGDSAFFSSLLPSLKRNAVQRIDSREDLNVMLSPDALPVPDDLDFEHYTYVVGRADVYSPCYYVSQDTLVYEDGCFTYTFDYFYSPSDSCSDHLICRKYEKIPDVGYLLLDLKSERRAGVIYGSWLTEYAYHVFGTHVPQINLEDGQCVLICEKEDLFDYMTFGEYTYYPPLRQVDFEKNSVILWFKKIYHPVEGFNVSFRPLSLDKYRYEVEILGGDSILDISEDVHYMSIIDKLPENATIESVLKEEI